MITETDGERGRLWYLREHCLDLAIRSFKAQTFDRCPSSSIIIERAFEFETYVKSENVELVKESD